MDLRPSFGLPTGTKYQSIAQFSVVFIPSAKEITVFSDTRQILQPRFRHNSQGKGARTSLLIVRCAFIMIQTWQAFQCHTTIITYKLHLLLYSVTRRYNGHYWHRFVLLGLMGNSTQHHNRDLVVELIIPL